MCFLHRGSNKSQQTVNSHSGNALRVTNEDFARGTLQVESHMFVSIASVSSMMLPTSTQRKPQSRGPDIQPPFVIFFCGKRSKCQSTTRVRCVLTSFFVQFPQCGNSLWGSRSSVCDPCACSPLEDKFITCLYTAQTSLQSINNTSQKGPTLVITCTLLWCKKTCVHVQQACGSGRLNNVRGPANAVVEGDDSSAVFCDQQVVSCNSENAF